MDNYKKIFVVRISADTNNLGSDFVEAHEDNWLSNADENGQLQDSEGEFYITPTDDEMTDSIVSEIKSWLEALHFGVHVDETEYDYLRNGLTVALNIMTDEQMREWDTDMEYKSEEE
tara:strand:- start:183 stop:533 length:351 start_codon:yes stop_codon:yes gene_type:complete